ncbi:MAG TPA: Uma2 family endonuclease [Candidatus Limnocylindrales bacterium]|nr:Uma2 family endonuclease [Candidatus Limnocylindrales bacterium]
MTAQPVTTDRWDLPKPPFTVDTLYDLPESDLRYEVLGGNLVLAPTPTFAHNLTADRIREALMPLLPKDVEAVTAMAVRMPNGDGPVPDLVITTADTREPKGLPIEKVHTVVEVVSPSSTKTDREFKTELYGSAGIPCYWRVELRGWKSHLGPVPAIVVRFFDRRLTTEHLFAAGEEHEIPLVIGPNMHVITALFDPAVLVGPRR